MKVALGSDHAGFDLKERIKGYLAGLGVEVNDLGTHSNESVDYPDYAEKVAADVRDGKADRGILVCGTGIGMCIAANKVQGIRAVQTDRAEFGRLSRRHNDSNVLCLAGRFTDPESAGELVKVWLETAFEGGPHQRRVEKIAHMEAVNGLRQRY